MYFASINPANNSVNRKYKSHTPKQVRQKIAQTHAAWQKWRLSSFKERSALLHKLPDVLNQRKNDLAYLMAIEMGKPLKQGLAEVEKCAAVCNYYADNAEGFLKEQL